MKEIFLTRGFKTIVDDGDYERLSKHRWFANTRGNNKTYACRVIKRDGKMKCINMARTIIRCRGKRLADHINGDSLDNRRCNIRSATVSQNAFNRIRMRNGKLPYRGISKHKDRWHASITKDHKAIFLGVFLTMEDAAKAYNAAALRCFGAFAVLNEIGIL